jgi:hypothetical protein
MQNSLPKYQSNKQYQHTPAERAYYRREKSECVGTLLESIAVEAGDDIALALARRIKKCASPFNHLLAKDLHNQDGECFDGFANLYGCGSKLCHTCMAKAANRNRKTAGEAIAETKLSRREHFCYARKTYVVEEEEYRFITLTMPKIKTSCIDSLEVLRRAWDLFRKLNFTEDYFGGYVKSNEFTVRSDETYHSHIHLLAISFFIPEKVIKRLWRRCVQSSFAEVGIDWREATKHLENADKLNVHLKRVNSIENALKEVCKYVTKSESWEKIPAAHLLEVANVRRFPRMFELAGRLKKTAKRIKEQKEFAKQIQLENQPKNADDIYFNTKCITAAENSPVDLQSKAKIVIKRENWRDIVEKLGVERYLKLLERQVEAIQKTRKEILIKKYPLATFVDLAGFAWYEPDIDFVEGFTENSMEMRA